MTISTPHPGSTIPTPTISPHWAPTGSPAATARMRTSPTGTSSSRSKRILDFGFWILDCRQGQRPATTDVLDLPDPIENPKPKTQNPNPFTLIQLLLEL